MGGKKRVVNTVVCHGCGKEFPVGDAACPWCHAENVGNEHSRQTWERNGMFWVRFRWFLLAVVLYAVGFFMAFASGSFWGFLLWIIVLVLFGKSLNKQPFMVRDREKYQEEKRLRETRKYAYPVKSVIITSSGRKSVSSTVGRGIVGGVLGGGIGAMVGLMSGKEIETVTFCVWWNDGYQTTEQALVDSVDYHRFMQVLT